MIQWIDDKYEQGSLENKLAKKIWFLDAHRLKYWVEKYFKKTIEVSLIEKNRDKLTKFFLAKISISKLASDFEVTVEPQVTFHAKDGTKTSYPIGYKIGVKDE